MSLRWSGQELEDRTCEAIVRTAKDELHLSNHEIQRLLTAIDAAVGTGNDLERGVNGRAWVCEAQRRFKIEEMWGG